MNIVIREKDKQILSLVGFIIVIVIDLVFILGWQWRSLFNNFRTANERKQTIMTFETDIVNLESYKQEIADLDEKIKNLELAITNEKDISILIEDISNLANNNGVKIIQIKPIIDDSDLGIIESKTGGFAEIGIQIVAKSDFHLLGNFLSKIESAKSFLKVSSLHIETDNKDYFIQNVRLSLNSVVHTKE